MRLLTLREVCEMTGLSRSSIYAMMAAGEFPRLVIEGSSDGQVFRELYRGRGFGCGSFS